MNLSSKSAEMASPSGITRRMLQNHPILPLLGVIFLSLVAGLMTQKYWNAHDAVVYIDQGETFLHHQPSGASLLYRDPHTFIHIGFHYLGAVFQAVSYRVFDDITGPHLVSLITLSLVAILVWHWSYLRSGRWQTAYLCAFAILFEPILRKSVYSSRIDIYAFFWGFLAFWLFERVRRTLRPRIQNVYFFGIGFCYMTACFMWMTSLIWGPFGLAYAIDIAFEQRWNFSTYLRRLGWTLLGVSLAATLITCPLWPRWTDVVHETIVGFSFAANPPWSTGDSNLTRFLYVIFRSPILIFPLGALALRWPRKSISDEQVFELNTNQRDLVTDHGEPPSPEWNRCKWLYGAAIGVAACSIFGTFVYPFRTLYLIPMMLFLLHELATGICWTSIYNTSHSSSENIAKRPVRSTNASTLESVKKATDRKMVECDGVAAHRGQKPFTTQNRHPWRNILICFFIGLFGFQTVDVFQNAHKLYRQREYRNYDWVIDAFRSIGITRCPVAIHSWHLYLVGRKLGWQTYSSAYFNPADVLQIPTVEYAILEPDNDHAEAFRQGLSDQHFEYVTTLRAPIVPYQTFFGNTLVPHYGPYELWQRTAPVSSTPKTISPQLRKPLP